MQIKMILPLVMKMELSTTLNQIENKNLYKIKEEIYQFIQVLERNGLSFGAARLGSSANIQLWNNTVNITTEALWQSQQKIVHCVQVILPSGRSATSIRNC